MITPELRAAQEAALAGLKARCDERRKAEEAELARQAAQDRRAAALASQVVDALRPFNGWLVKGQARNCPTGPVTLTDTAEVAYGVSRTTARRRVEFRPHWDDLCVKVEAEEGVDTSHWGLIAHGAQQAIGTAADLPVLVRAVGARLADLCVGPAPAVVLPPLPPDPEGWHRVFQYTGDVPKTSHPAGRRFTIPGRLFHQFTVRCSSVVGADTTKLRVLYRPLR